MIQFLIDGLVNGAIIALGAVGLSISYNVMRFANFAQGEVMAVGAYISLAFVAMMGLGIGRMGPVSFGWPLLVSMIFSILITAIVVLVTDLLVFRMLRDKESSRITFIIVAFWRSVKARKQL
jgi:branched-chain amino acid transport system permease protein